MKKTMTRVLKGLILLGISFPIAGCQTNTGTGALVGGAAGAGIGAAAFHNSAYGALVGGTLGALTGAAIGNAADREQAYRNGYYYYGPYGPTYYYAPPPPGYYYAPPPPPRYISYPAHPAAAAPNNQAAPSTGNNPAPADAPGPATQPANSYQDYQR
jgi:hypothetical protein